MPSGKLANEIASGFVASLPDAVSIQSLEKYRRVIKPLPEVATEDEIQLYERQLRFRLRQYIAASQTPHVTPTQRRDALKKIKSATIKFIRRPSPESANLLLNNMQSIDRNTSMVLVEELTSQSLERSAWQDTRRSLGDYYQYGCWIFYTGEPDDYSIAVRKLAIDALAKSLPVLDILSKIEPDELVPRQRARFPNPAMADLVLALSPIWKRFTGRSLTREYWVDTSKGKHATHETNNVEDHHYYEWLKSIFDAAGLDTAGLTKGLVDDVARDVAKTGP